MDLSAATEPIAGTAKDINSFYESTVKKYNEIAKQINEDIDSLEKVTNDFYKGTVSSMKWVEMQIHKFVKLIVNTFESLVKSINNITAAAKKWYNDTITEIKASVIKSYYAKMGESCSEKEAELIAKTIPHPSFDSLMPTIEFDFPLPPETTNVDHLKGFKFKKLPIIEI